MRTVAARRGIFISHSVAAATIKYKNSVMLLSGSFERAIVSRHLDVSLAARGGVARASAHVHCPLPVRDARRAARDQLLIAQQRLQREIDAEFRHDHAP